METKYHVDLKPKKLHRYDMTKATKLIKDVQALCLQHMELAARAKPHPDTGRALRAGNGQQARAFFSFADYEGYTETDHDQYIKFLRSIQFMFDRFVFYQKEYFADNQEFQTAMETLCNELCANKFAKHAKHYDLIYVHPGVGRIIQLLQNVVTCFDTAVKKYIAQNKLVIDLHHDPLNYLN